MNLKSILLGAALGLPALPALADIVVTAPYARSSSPAAHSGATFMVITNTGPEADHLEWVATGVAHRVGLYTNVIENGIAKMPPVPEGFDIAPGKSLVLQRGGNHIMMMGISRPLQQGGHFAMILHFSKAGNVTVDVPIDNTRTPSEGGGEADMGGMDMGADGASGSMDSMSNN